MPSVELHGASNDQAAFAKRAIANALKSASYAKDIVVSHVPSQVTDIDGKASPFLRVYITAKSSEMYLRDLMIRLYKLQYDIEVMELKNFSPKR